MAISIANKTSGANIAVGVTTFATASITTVTGRLYVMSVFLSAVTLSSVSSALGVTWTPITTATSSGSAAQLTVLYGICTSGGTGTWTVTASTSNYGYSYSIEEVTGAAASSPIVQNSSVSASTSSPTSGTLSAFSNAGNATIAAWAGYGAATAPTITVEAGWTQLASVTAVAALAVKTGRLLSSDTTPSCTWTGGSGANLSVCGVYFEVAAFVPAAFGTAPAVNSLMRMGMGV